MHTYIYIYSFLPLLPGNPRSPGIPGIPDGPGKPGSPIAPLMPRSIQTIDRYKKQFPLCPVVISMEGFIQTFIRYLPDDILVKVDRMSMAHSLEIRAPFLNHTFAEWAIRLPTKAKLHFLQTKALLKKAQEKILPSSIIYAKKEGFNAPVSQWLTQTNKERMLDNKIFQEWFKEKEIQRLWNAHASGHADNGLKLFGLLCLSLWMEKK